MEPAHEVRVRTDNLSEEDRALIVKARNAPPTDSLLGEISRRAEFLLRGHRDDEAHTLEEAMELVRYRRRKQNDLDMFGVHFNVVLYILPFDPPIKIYHVTKTVLGEDKEEGIWTGTIPDQFIDTFFDGVKMGFGGPIPLPELPRNPKEMPEELHALFEDWVTPD